MIRTSTTWRTATCGAAIAALTLTGCADMSEREKGTAVGAGVGAGAGAIIAGATGGRAGTGRADRRRTRRGGRQPLVQAHGRPPDRDGERHARHEHRGQPHGRQPVEAQHPERHLVRHQQLRDQAELRGLLDPFANSLRDDPATRLTIIGHTDSTGTDAINNPLSVERAQSVRDYIAARGVSPQRIETAGRGSREPIADNGSDAGRAKNRRVEIFLREPAA